MGDSVTFDEHYARRLEPDMVLPSQFFAGHKRTAYTDGERRLMLAVLEDAVRCFRKRMRARDAKGRQLFREAEEWFTATDRSWFFSFANVCEALDLDADYVREGVLAWRDDERTLRLAARHARAAGDVPAPLQTANGV